MTMWGDRKIERTKKTKDERPKRKETKNRKHKRTKSKRQKRASPDARSRSRVEPGSALLLLFWFSFPFAEDDVEDVTKRGGRR